MMPTQNFFILLLVYSQLGEGFFGKNKQVGCVFSNVCLYPSLFFPSLSSAQSHEVVVLVGLVGLPGAENLSLVQEMTRKADGILENFIQGETRLGLLRILSVIR